jgi:hypothetical protein
MDAVADEPKENPRRFPQLRHWVLFVALAVAFAQFYFLTVLVQVYSTPQVLVFAATWQPGAMVLRPGP